MTVEVQGIPLNQVLTFPFRGPHALKRLLALCGLCLAGAFVPILPGLFVSGYLMLLLREAIHDGRVEMPEWKDLNRLLRDGLSSTVISLGYLLPGLVVFFGGIIFYFAILIFTIPGSRESGSTMPPTIFFAILVFFAALSLGSLLLLAGGIPLPIALARFADQGRLRAAFEFREIWRALKANPVGYLGAWIVFLGFFYLASFAYYVLYMSIVCCCFSFVPLLVGIGGGGLIFTAMIGLAYRQGLASVSKSE